MTLFKIYLFLYLFGFLIPQKTTHPVLNNIKIPVTISHQGGNKVYPDQSMLAFNNSVRLGIQVLELDVHRTSDSVLVIHHDTSIDRLTNKTGIIKEMTWGELQSVDGAYNWTINGEDYPYRGKGVKILSLEQLFDQYPNQLYDIEIKQNDPPIENDLCDLLRKYDIASDQVIVASFYDNIINRFHDVCPEVAISLSVNKGTKLYVLSRIGLERLLPVNSVIAQLPLTFPSPFGDLKLDKRYINAFSNGERQVWVWTVDDSSTMEEVIEMGAHGILTDRPDVLMNVIQ